MFSGGNSKLVLLKSLTAIKPDIKPIADDSTYPSTPVICPENMMFGQLFKRKKESRILGDLIKVFL